MGTAERLRARFTTPADLGRETAEEVDALITQAVGLSEVADPQDVVFNRALAELLAVRIEVERGRPDTVSVSGEFSRGSNKAATLASLERDRRAALRACGDGGNGLTVVYGGLKWIR